MTTNSLHSEVLEFCLHHSEGSVLRGILTNEQERIADDPKRISGGFQTIVSLYVEAQSSDGSLENVRCLVVQLDKLADDEGVAPFLFNELQALMHPGALDDIRKMIGEQISEPVALIIAWLTFHRTRAIGEMRPLLAEKSAQANVA